MADWYPLDIGHTQVGYVLSLRAQLAAEIVKHCALVVGYPNGEDGAGRSKLDLLPSEAVASRANAIALALVDEWEQLGWIRPTTMTHEEDWQRTGELKTIAHEAEYSGITARMAARAELAEAKKGLANQAAKKE